jgi:hypothetical protein
MEKALFHTHQLIHIQWWDGDRIQRHLRAQTGRRWRRLREIIVTWRVWWEGRVRFQLLL